MSDAGWHGVCFIEGMVDLVFIVVTVSFFAASVAYVAACDRL